MLVNGAHSFGGRQIKILHSLKFDPGAEPSSQGLQINSCSIHLVDIKKEKPFFNSEVRLRAQARTGYNRVSDIIGKADKEKVELGSQEPGKRLGHQGPASQSRWLPLLGQRKEGQGTSTLCCEFSRRDSPGTQKVSEDR